MKLILARHGRTIENEQKIIQGHMPGNLTEEGIEQAKKLAKRLQTENIDIIYSSDLKRAVDTAKIIAEPNNTPLILTEQLREGNPGDFQGRQTGEVDWENRPANAETQEQVKDRATNFLNKIFQENKEKTVLFVSHAGLNKFLIAELLGKDTAFSRQIRQTNTALNIFEIKEDKKHIIYAINCTRHLA